LIINGIYNMIKKRLRRYLLIISKLFQSQNTYGIDNTVKVVQDQITEEMKHHLNSVFTKEEVFAAIRDMKSLAAPGPAGLPAMFYHTYWDIVGPT
jgi:Zn-dependent oligopeptidase